METVLAHLLIIAHLTEKKILQNEDITCWFKLIKEIKLEYLTYRIASEFSDRFIAVESSAVMSVKIILPQLRLSVVVFLKVNHTSYNNSVRP